MLGPMDEFPVHQLPQPIAWPGSSDRNFYDRSYFNAHDRSGDIFVISGLGYYPNLGVKDAFLLVARRDGRFGSTGHTQTAVHLSDAIDQNRLNQRVGNYHIEVSEPLQRLRIHLDKTDGIAADLTWNGLFPVVQEQRHILRTGTRITLDAQRFAQLGSWSGHLEVDGEMITVDPETWIGSRDRSWGIRPIGAGDPQPTVPPVPPQFFWLWSPCSFEDGSLFFHTNDDAHGRPWNTRAVWSADGCAQDGHEHFDFPKMQIEWKSGTRYAKKATVALDDRDPQAGSVTFEPLYEFLMFGLGYGHPKWRHGALIGKLEVEREDIDLKTASPQAPQNLHVQALSKVTYRDRAGKTREGRGVLEQLVMGPHEPSGFKQILDWAP